MANMAKILLKKVLEIIVYAFMVKRAAAWVATPSVDGIKMTLKRGGRKWDFPVGRFDYPLGKIAKKEASIGMLVTHYK
jgi:hypothetical protein